MKYYLFKPENKLSRYVNYLWLCEAYIPQSRYERNLPNGVTDIAINLEGKPYSVFDYNNPGKRIEYSSSVVVGPHTRYVFLTPDTRVNTMGAVLNPGATLALFGIPAYEFQNRIVNLESIIGSGIGEIRSHLSEASTHGEKIKILQAFLLGLVNNDISANRIIKYAIQELKISDTRVTVQNMVKKFGISQKHFIHLFKNEIGMPPKTFLRICRFHQLLDRLVGQSSPDWTDIALNSGYYDQAHMIHEFKSITGIQPTGYETISRRDRKYMARYYMVTKP